MSARCSFLLGSILLVGPSALSLACSSASPPPAADASAQPASPAEETTLSEPATEASETDVPDASAASSKSTPEPSEPPPPSVAEICENLCVRVDSACKGSAGEQCRGFCREYVAAAERCPVEVAEALECQLEASDTMLCANVAASSCVPEFTEMTECRAGQRAPRAQRVKKSGDAVDEELPPNWARTDDEEFGISLPFPLDVTVEGSGAERKLVAREDDVEYVVDSPPRFAGEPTDRAILRAVLDYVGTPCHKSLKVHGRFEKGGAVHVHIDTACKDGRHLRGMFHVAPDRIVVTSARANAPLRAPEIESRLEALFYGFRFVKP